jgi:hypothetical protein
MGDAAATSSGQARARQFRSGLAALKARVGEDQAMRLLVRASEALDVLGIDRKAGVYLALRGAERLADDPGLTTAALADELRPLWAMRDEPEGPA